MKISVEPYEQGFSSDPILNVDLGQKDIWTYDLHTAHASCNMTLELKCSLNEVSYRKLSGNYFDK